MSSDKMKRVTKTRPCPICGKPDWCLVVEDGSAAICARTAEGSVKKCGDAGYLHILEDRHDGHDRHKSGAKWRHILTVVHGAGSGTRDFEKMARQCQSRLTDERLQTLTDALGVSVGSLQRLRLGWDGSAWTFPMSDAAGKIVGIRRRFPGGRKASVKGSKTGLFIPTDLPGVGPLLLCEGPSDTAAALDLGFDAIGRPNCNSLVEMTVRAVRGRDDIVIMADNDVVGRMGADRLASVLALCCQSVCVVHPPAGVKDLRQWFNAGLTSEALRQTIAGMRPIDIQVSFSLARAAKGVQP